MRIDIHAHTIKTKSGDSPNRNITPSNFAEIIKETDVKILAITNHNHFNIDQYQQILEKTKGVCQIWPGVELDVQEEDRRGHILVIVNPDNAILFSKIIETLCGSNYDNFTISIEDIVKNFKDLDVILIPHYIVKQPSLNDEDIEKLYNIIANKNRLIKEVTNSISAGIYIRHGHKTIYGSDIQDWNKYAQLAENLPELRLPVSSYNQFCLLLDKDEPTINTLLDHKCHERITIEPFGSEEAMSIDIYNDINIFFGPKGTGKTEILKAISNHYNRSGLKTSVYESSRDNLCVMFDIKGKELKIHLESNNIQSCSLEISDIKKAKEVNITSLSSYFKFFSSQINNKRASSIKIKDYTLEDTTILLRKFLEINGVYEVINIFMDNVSNSRLLEELLEDELSNELKTVLNKVRIKLDKERESKYINSRTMELYNSLIGLFNDEIARKTGRPSKPTSTGFSKYARNRIKLEKNVNQILESINTKIISSSEYVGDLGQKGHLSCKTDMVIQDGSITDGQFSPVKDIKKNPQKEFAKVLIEIEKSLYSSNLFEMITELNEISDIDDINDIDDLILFKRYFALNNTPYTPSNGESSMLLLHKELSEDKEVYILDEPEKSLGNDYINDAIVPLLKDRKRQIKRWIVPHIIVMR